MLTMGWHSSVRPQFSTRQTDKTLPGTIATVAKRERSVTHLTLTLKAFTSKQHVSLLLIFQ